MPRKHAYGPIIFIVFKFEPWVVPLQCPASHNQISNTAFPSFDSVLLHSKFYAGWGLLHRAQQAVLPVCARCHHVIVMQRSD